MFEKEKNQQGSAEGGRSVLRSVFVSLFSMFLTTKIFFVVPVCVCVKNLFSQFFLHELKEKNISLIIQKSSQQKICFCGGVVFVLVCVEKNKMFCLF